MAGEQALDVRLLFGYKIRAKVFAKYAPSFYMTKQIDHISEILNASEIYGCSFADNTFVIICRAATESTFKTPALTYGRCDSQKKTTYFTRYS